MDLFKNPNSVTTITINTDASFHPEHGVGGYAFWIVCDHFRVRNGGQFKTKVSDSHEAEVMAIGNALAAILKIKKLPSSKWLIINTDCKGAIDQILKRSNQLAKRVFNLWQKLIARLGSTKNKFRHVRAHTNKQDARSVVNNWCDRVAKFHMVRAVELKLKQSA